MNNIQAISSGYKETNTGSIDYQYYDQRARNIRSESVWSLFKGIFSDKKISRIEGSEECDVLIYNRTKVSSEDNSSLKQAA